MSSSVILIGIIVRLVYLYTESFVTKENVALTILVPVKLKFRSGLTVTVCATSQLALLNSIVFRSLIAIVSSFIKQFIVTTFLGLDFREIPIV